MNLPNQKEQFSLAYVRAVASVAGYVVSRQEVDEDSVDLTLSGRSLSGASTAPRLDVQLKCTAQNFTQHDSLRFPLKRKNYEELRGSGFIVPRILVVVTVPESPRDWLVQSEDELILRRCGYWLSLKNAPATDNQTSVTLRIPRSNLFTVSALTRLMEQIATGDWP